jgi:hypothetical protein
MSSDSSRERQGFEAVNKGGTDDEASLSKEARGSTFTGVCNPAFAGIAKAETETREKTSTLGCRKMMRRQVMEGKGPRFERETVITFNEADSSASVWTASETVYRRLKKLGYVPTRDDERSAVFEIPKAVVRVLKPRVKRELTERQREALKKGHSSSKALDIIQANEHEIADG